MGGLVFTVEEDECDQAHRLNWVLWKWFSLKVFGGGS